MSLMDANQAIESELIALAKSINAKLQFETRKHNSDATSDILLSCSYLPIDPLLVAFRQKREQTILQIDYICDIKAKTINDEENLKSIIGYFNIDKVINRNVSVYRPTARSQWLNKDSKRIAVISVYLQFDEVI